jgi:hypothetical protein
MESFIAGAGIFLAGVGAGLWLRVLLDPVIDGVVHGRW